MYATDDILQGEVYAYECPDDAVTDSTLMYTTCNTGGRQMSG